YQEVEAEGDDGSFRFVKGAPEVVVGMIDASEDVLGALQRSISDLADQGRKVIAVAGGAKGAPLELVGVLGLGDPVRPETKVAVGRARDAGVSVVMVTGDHPSTALSIASESGIESAAAVTGAEIDDKGLPPDPLSVSVYARTTPQHKLDLVKALQERGEVVAVTGDGVNDAPALHQADIGVAMGHIGTDVAKEASDLVITNDDLATIVLAIREGRAIYDNIRKVVDYLVAANLSEIIVVIAALIVFPDLGVPLLPLQLLWINLVTDGLPALALGMDTESGDLMHRPPRRRSQRLLAGRHLEALSARALVIAASCLGAAAVAHFAWDEPWPHARSSLFVSLALAQLVYAFVVRSGDRSTSDRKAMASLFDNRWLIAGALGGISLIVLATVWRPLASLVGVPWLSPREWLLVSIAAVVPSIALVTAARLRRGMKVPSA
ncbi:MAG TPA: HAD-IC family P-type ATPase, partial [Actinomycetota bacterium]|nr:HAD-IC family P-type ATPase [Actinomycetota bacterium]